MIYKFPFTMYNSPLVNPDPKLILSKIIYTNLKEVIVSAIMIMIIIIITI